VLSIKNIHVSFNHKEIIKDLSFELDEGEVLTIIGPNGSGKTTLLKAILGIIPVKAGVIRVFGKKDIGDLDAERLIAYIPQRMEVDRTYPISLREMLSLSLRGAYIEKYIDMLELRGLLDKRIGELSGGEFQRALLTYALIKEPKLLLMDEPTSWVDVKGSDCILCTIEDFKKKGIAVIFVSHDITIARSISTKVLGLSHGGHFLEPVHSPRLEEEITALFGTRHHGLCERGGEGICLP
jgi:zinc transport system ATP-binding protein